MTDANLDHAALLQQLAQHGEALLVDGDEAARWRVQGKTPRLVSTPSSPEALAGVLKACAEAGAAVVPWGGGTQQNLGEPPARLDVVLRTQALNRVLEWEPADLTATVEAGMRFTDFQQVLAERNQRLPLDPPLDEAATVGGLIATNASGPRRLKDGALRDLVIGTRVAGVDGQVTRAGGKVVKNVTGYDINKLHIGALGTLGVLVEVTVKVAPRPETERTWLGVFATAQEAARMVSALLRRPITPTALELLNDQTAARLGVTVAAGRWVLAARADGFAPAVARHLREFEAAAREAGVQDGWAVAEEEGKALWRRYARLGAELRWTGRALTCRLALPPAALGTVGAEAARTGARPLVWGSGTGALFWSVAAEDADQAWVAQLRALATQAGGALVVENRPAALTGLDVWGPPGGPLKAMRAIKAEYDPRGTLNPGRFVGGI